MENILAKIRTATNNAWALGNDRFQKRIEKLTAGQASPKPRGGDRKSEVLPRIICRLFGIDREMGEDHIWLSLQNLGSKEGSLLQTPFSQQRLALEKS